MNLTSIFRGGIRRRICLRMETIFCIYLCCRWLRLFFISILSVQQKLRQQYVVLNHFNQLLSIKLPLYVFINDKVNDVTTGNTKKGTFTSLADQIFECCHVNAQPDLATKKIQSTESAYGV